jgi:hypothetical protein
LFGSTFIGLADLAESKREGDEVLERDGSSLSFRATRNLLPRGLFVPTLAQIADRHVE